MFLERTGYRAERSQTVTDSGRGEAADVAASPDDDHVARILGRRRLRLRERRVEQRVARPQRDDAERVCRAILHSRQRRLRQPLEEADERGVHLGRAFLRRPVAAAR